VDDSASAIGTAKQDLATIVFIVVLHVSDYQGPITHRSEFDEARSAIAGSVGPLAQYASHAAYLWLVIISSPICANCSTCWMIETVRIICADKHSQYQR
jgi:hypothetical protein